MHIKTPEKITLGWAVALIVIGVILGIVFTFGMEFWSSDVRREECTLVTAELSECKVNIDTQAKQDQRDHYRLY